MGRKKKFKKSVFVRARIEEEKYLILKERFNNVSEAVRKAIDLLLQQVVQQQVQIPNSTMVMGRNFNAGNITHVINNDINNANNIDNANNDVCGFLNSLEHHALLEKLEWAKKKLAESYRKAYSYYKEIEQMTNSESQLDIRPLKRHLSENLNQCNKYLFVIRDITVEFKDKKIPMPEESVAFINQFYELFQQLKHEAKKNNWIIEEILYKNWGKRRKTPKVMENG